TVAACGEQSRRGETSSEDIVGRRQACTDLLHIATVSARKNDAVLLIDHPFSGNSVFEFVIVETVRRVALNPPFIVRTEVSAASCPDADTFNFIVSESRVNRTVVKVSDIDVTASKNFHKTRQSAELLHGLKRVEHLVNARFI